MKRASKPAKLTARARLHPFFKRFAENNQRHRANTSWDMIHPPDTLFDVFLMRLSRIGWSSSGMIHNTQSALLLAIVAAAVGHGHAAGGLPCQGPATTAGASGHSASGAVLDGHSARAPGTSVAAGRPAPPAADP